MDNKKVKQAISISALAIAIVSFLSLNNDDVNITKTSDDEETKHISGYARPKPEVNNVNTSSTQETITRSFVSKAISVLGLIISIIFKTIVTLIKAGFTLSKLSNNVFFNIFIDSLAIFIILLTIFIVLFKLLYPDHSLKEFLTFKNILIIYLSSLLISIILNTCDLFKNQKALLIILEGISISLIIFYLYRFLLNSNSKILIGPKALIKSKEGKRDILITLVYILFSSVLKILAIDNKVLGIFINLIYVFVIIGIIAYFISKKRKRKLVDIELSFPALD